jgi:hypothetical protein
VGHGRDVLAAQVYARRREHAQVDPGLSPQHRPEREDRARSRRCTSSLLPRRFSLLTHHIFLQLLLDIADEFIDSVTNFGCRLAKHRGGDALEVRDLQLHLGTRTHFFSFNPLPIN